MASSVPGAKVETEGNKALNGHETPSWPATEGAQFTLGSADSKCSLAASRMAALVKEAQRASDFTLGTVAHLAGKETPYVSKCLDAEDPHAVLKMLAAVVYLDKSRTWLRGLTAMAGCDLVERQEISDAEFRRRVEAWSRRGRLNGEALGEALKPEDAP
jgi:hypothetical protein